MSGRRTKQLRKECSARRGLGVDDFRFFKKNGITRAEQSIALGNESRKRTSRIIRNQVNNERIAEMARAAV